MESPPTCRAFLALTLADEVRAQLVAAQENLRTCGARVAWVPPENLHLTVLFLGDVFPEVLEAMKADLDAACAEIPAFELELAGTGVFGPARAPRVAWAGVRQVPPGLLQLHERVTLIADRRGIPLEKRPFSAHVTLGRIKSPIQALLLTSAIRSLNSVRFGSSPVHGLHLMRSHLDEPRVRYSILNTSPLKGTVTHG